MDGGDGLSNWQFYPDVVRYLLRAHLGLLQYHPLDRVDGLKVLRRDIGLRNGQIEFGLDLEHQLDHVHRRQSGIKKP